jgi:hypothetical protein
MGTDHKTKTDKISALKAQLNVRKYVLMQQPEDKDLFNFTKSVGKQRMNLTVEELTTNVKKLVEHALTLTPSSSDNADEEDVPILVGRNIKMYFEGNDGAVKTSWIGHVISTVHILFSWQLLVCVNSSDL